jgi:multiple sugar transport system permease protein
MSLTQPTTGAMPPAAQAAGVAATPGTVRTRRPDRWYRPRSIIGRGILWLLLLMFSLLFLYPFIWLLAASLKPKGQVFDNKLIPETFKLSNYAEVWDQLPLLHWMGNSILIALLAATFVAFSSSLVAFGFAYFKFPGRNFLFGLVLATMMLPGAVTLIPQYLIWKNLGFLGTNVPLWGGQPVRLCLLHLPAAAVLPRAAA